MMNIQELATLAELDLPVTVIVLQNGTLGMVRQQQKYLYDGTYSASEFIRPSDFMALGNAFGILSVDADTDREWYKKAFAAEGKKPRLVLLRINPEDDVLPYVKTGYANIEAVGIPQH
jgi:acetolactate synthase-1/2/3 large subunit